MTAERIHAGPASAPHRGYRIGVRHDERGLSGKRMVV